LATSLPVAVRPQELFYRSSDEDALSARLLSFLAENLGSGKTAVTTASGVMVGRARAAWEALVVQQGIVRRLDEKGWFVAEPTEPLTQL